MPPDTASHRTGTREEWLAARRELLDREKEHTRRSDELAQARRDLPWVPIDKEYRFDTDDGTKTLAELFDGRSQLLVYHLMFGPDYEAACPNCTAIADGFQAFGPHMAARDVTLTAISRAPLPKLQAYKERMGWEFPWASSYDGEFNYDFSASYTPDQLREGAEYNFRRFAMASMPESGGAVDAATSSGADVAQFLQEAPGMSAFALQDGVVHHTYSAYARGLDGLWGIYQWLDRAPLGRGEDDGFVLFRRRDEYES